MFIYLLSFYSVCGVCVAGGVCPRPIKLVPLILLYTMSYRYCPRLKKIYYLFPPQFLFRRIVPSLLDKSAVGSRFALAHCIKENGGSEFRRISMGDGI